MARSPDSARGALGLGLSGGEGGWKTTSSALGAAYKAAWGFAREKGWEWGSSSGSVEAGGQGEGEGVGEEGEGEKEKRSFSKFVRDVKSAARSDGREQEEEQRGRSPRNKEREAIDFGAGASGGEEREGGEDGVRRRLEEVSVGGSVWTEDGPDPSEEQEEGAREGLTLVATPDKEEFKFYASMLREHVRLDTNARRGLI
ncbi:hypothetical protein BCR35DRAFT_188495 [Leucosporidium creatinivorum]|uniref:Uncharacterized protein n=1 Tax=Leucosporidium creatinivorum TaxID=106004 RepID=A0A1Y2DUM0_9BASI|nr:hypothetical protein BCR35DRAFT_188495 [Leucosporidium creatinivorum]